jgi:hypothetical protein
MKNYSVVIESVKGVGVVCMGSGTLAFYNGHKCIITAADK